MNFSRSFSIGEFKGGVHETDNHERQFTIRDCVYRVSLLIHLNQMASAEGGKIAFSLDGEIYIIDDNGKNLQRLTDHPARDRLPAWLPDGRHILFSSDRDRNRHLYTMDLAGKNIKRVADENGRPAISPDGQWIAQTVAGFLLLVDIDGLKKPKEIHWGRPQGATNMAAWSPDGKKIAFTIRIPGVMNDIYVIDITGDNFRRLTEHLWTRFVSRLVP